MSKRKKIYLAKVGSPQKRELMRKINQEIEHLNARIQETYNTGEKFKKSLEVTKFNIQLRNGDPGQNTNVGRGELILKKFKKFIGDFLLEYEGLLEPIKRGEYSKENYVRLTELKMKLSINDHLLRTRISEVSVSK